MSERPKWMPSVTDVQEQSDLHLGWADDEAMDFIYHVGLRAQIAVLEEMMDRMKAHLGLLQNAEVRYAYELLRDRRDALRKELGA